MIDKSTLRYCHYCLGIHQAYLMEQCPLNPKRERNQVSQQDQQLEALYGPLAPYSEHKRGDVITYEQGDAGQATGTILWVCGPGEVVEGGQSHPLRYIVENQAGGWPDTVYPSEVKVS